MNSIKYEILKFLTSTRREPDDKSLFLEPLSNGGRCNSDPIQIPLVLTVIPLESIASNWINFDRVTVDLKILSLFEFLVISGQNFAVFVSKKNGRTLRFSVSLCRNCQNLFRFWVKKFIKTLIFGFFKVEIVKKNVFFCQICSVFG